jgi:hypothetical protein
MFKLKKQIEGHIQEIVFFFSILLAFTTFLSGILYLAFSTESLTYILGQFGAIVDQGLFSFLGYAFFYLSVVVLHMGYVMNFHIFSFRDFKKEYPVLLYSLLAHSIIVVLFSNMLSVIQLSLEIPNSALLTRGAGGMMGHLLSGALYSNVGIYGSVISLLALMGVTALLGGFFEIPDVVMAVKVSSKITKNITTKSLKTMNSSLISGIQFLAKANEGTEATAHAGGGHRSPNWISNSWSKANHLMTDHFHIYKKEEKDHEKKETSKKDDDKKIQKIPLSVEKPVQLESPVVHVKNAQKVKTLSKAKAEAKPVAKVEMKTAVKAADKSTAKAPVKSPSKANLKIKAKKK